MDVSPVARSIMTTMQRSQTATLVADEPAGITIQPPGPASGPASGPRSPGGPVSGRSSSVDGRLPRPVSSFVGRKREVDDLCRHLTTSRLVTVVGPAGIGKTRLALEVASRARPQYPGGVWLVDLAPVADDVLVPQAVATALALPPEPGRDTTEALVSHLRDTRALLLLDNCEHLLDACGGLARRVVDDTGGVSVLATSQRALGIEGERVVPVTPMSLPAHALDTPAGTALLSEAVELFCDRAATSSGGAFRLTDEVSGSVAAICRHLDGIPLAIELAAARAGVLAPAEIHERLHDRFTLLARGASTAPARHHTLRAALDWSYDLLSPAQAALLRRLSVFAGGANLRAVEQVCSGVNVARPQVLDLVSDLVARSLVVADTTGPRARYRLLETIRDYGRERLEEADELESMRARHAVWCLESAERAWHQLTPDDTDSLEAEIDNVRAALEWAVGDREGDLGLRLANAMTVFYKVRGQFREGLVWLERALRSCIGADQPLRARSLWGVGLLAVLQGEVATATRAVEESLSLSRACGFGRGEAQALNLLGFISIFTQDPLSARPLLEQSVAQARAAGDAWWLVETLKLYGRVHLFTGDVAAAREVFDECLELTKAGGDEDGVGAIIGLGWAAAVAGEFGRAQELFARALPVVRASGERFEIALVLSFLGELAWARGDRTEARRLFDEGLVLARAMGAPFPLVRCIDGLARLAIADGDLAEARSLADEACAQAGRSRLPYARVRCLHTLGLVLASSGDADGAQASFDEALAAALEGSDEAGAALSLHHLGCLARVRGNEERAASLHTDALTRQVRVPDAAGIASSLESLAGLSVAVGRGIQAARLFGAAQAIRDGAGAPRPPDEEATYGADVAALCTTMGAADREKAWTEGTQFSTADAVTLATRGRGSRGRPSFGWESLTPAERQVVDLAAAGLTNVEIGEKLFVSARTVQGRLLRIFPKLGVTSRRQLREVQAGQ